MSDSNRGKYLVELALKVNNGTSSSATHGVGLLDNIIDSEYGLQIQKKTTKPILKY